MKKNLIESITGGGGKGRGNEGALSRGTKGPQGQTRKL